MIRTDVLDSLSSEVINLKKLRPENDSSALEAQIDRLVYQLYGLTDEEIALVEASFR
jgi:hypothetical protein